MEIKYENWQIVRKLGTGSFGSVYEIERNDFGVYKAALKVISIPQQPEEINDIKSSGMSEQSISNYYYSMVEEIVSEFALMSKLKGTSNIVSYEDHKVIPHEEGIGWDIYIRMELLTPLDKYIQEHPLSEADITRLGIDICRGLERCQKLNIIHRDIKPGNIFVSDQGDFKIGDFGIARTVERTASNMSRKGTTNYMAPEVYNGMEYGLTVDIYSLGLVMYRLLNHNRTPFLPPFPEPIKFQDQEMALFKRINGTPLPYPNNEVSELGDVVLKACAFDPKDRYQSPSSFRRALEKVARKYLDLTETLTPPTAGAAIASEISASENTIAANSADVPVDVVAMADEKGLEATKAIVATKPAKKETPAIDKTDEAQSKNSSVIADNAKTDNASKNKKPIIIVAAAVVVAVILLIVLLAKPDSQKTAEVPETTTTQAETESVTETTTETTTAALVKIEDYTGKQLADVQEALEAEGLKVDVSEVDGTEAKDTIVEQSLEAGTAVEKGETISLIVSKDNQLLMPSFQGKALKKFKQELDAEANEITIIIADTPVFKEDIKKAGRVASVYLINSDSDSTNVDAEESADQSEETQPAEDSTASGSINEDELKQLLEEDANQKTTLTSITTDETLEKGSTLLLYLSGVYLPDNIIGLDENQARTALSELGLKVSDSVSFDYRSDMSSGIVTNVVHDDGYTPVTSEELLGRNDIIQLVISQYVEPVTQAYVPDTDYSAPAQPSVSEPSTEITVF